MELHDGAAMKQWIDGDEGMGCLMHVCGQRKSTCCFTRIFHRGHVRVGCAVAPLNRVRSARTKLDWVLEAKKVCIHAVLRDIGERPGEISGLAARHPPMCTVRRGPQSVWTPQHDAYHGQRDQQRTQNACVKSTVGHGLQRAGYIAQDFG